MSENDFLKTLKSHLTKAVVSIVITFIGSVIITVFTVRGHTQEIDELKSCKAERTEVKQEFDGIERQLNELHEDIKTGQEILINILTDK